MADSPAASATAQAWPDWPAYALIDDLFPTLERWCAQGRRFALATLVDVQGSSPRPAGSEMAIADDGECAGYVSGGCVEAAVAAEALESLRDGRVRLLDYGAGSPVLDLRLSCDGRIRILVRPVDPAALHVEKLRDARHRRAMLTVATDLASGARRYDDPRDTVLACGLHDSGTPRYVQRMAPPLRLVLVGNDPVVLALLRLAPGLGMETVLLRPRGPALPADGSVAPTLYDRRGIDTALAALELDGRCAVYTLAHDSEIDHAAMRRGLASAAFAVGALGSRRKAELRRQRLRNEGFDEASLQRLHTPAGLDIGARTPQEIALSILAQIVERSRVPTAA